MKKIIEFLKRPKGWFLALAYALAAVFVGFSLACVALDKGGWYAYAAYALAALSLAYSVYTLVKFGADIKKQSVAAPRKYRFTARILDDFAYRTLFFSVAAFLLNAAFAIFEGVLAVVGHSVWYGALAAYYLVLSGVRLGVVLYGAKTDRSDRKKCAKIYRACGISLLVLTLALSAAVVQMVLYDKAFTYAGTMIYAAAAYAFLKLSLAIRNLVRAKRYDDAVVQSLRNINFAAALVSLLGLQTALISAFSDGGMFIMNAVSGGAVCLLIIGTGIFMIARASVALKEDSYVGRK